MDKVEEVKKILERFRKLDDIDLSSYQAGVNQERNLNGAVQEICQLFSQFQLKENEVKDE